MKAPVRLRNPAQRVQGRRQREVQPRVRQGAAQRRASLQQYTRTRQRQKTAIGVDLPGSGQGECALWVDTFWIER